jgi:hypothetical protein
MIDQSPAMAARCWPPDNWEGHDRRVLPYCWSIWGGQRLVLKAD